MTLCGCSTDEVARAAEGDARPGRDRAPHIAVDFGLVLGRDDRAHLHALVEHLGAGRGLQRSGRAKFGDLAAAHEHVVRRVDPGARVVTVFPDGPHRYLGSVYDDDFAAAHGLDPAAAATRPVEIPHARAVEASGWVRCTTVTDPLLTPLEGSP